MELVSLASIDPCQLLSDECESTTPIASSHRTASRAGNVWRSSLGPATQGLIPARPVEDQVRVRARAVGHHGRAEERDGVLLEQRLLGRRPRRRRRGRQARDVVEGAPVAREPGRPRALLGAPVLELVPHSPPPAHLGSDHRQSLLCPGGLGSKEVTVSDEGQGATDGKPALAGEIEEKKRNVGG